MEGVAGYFDHTNVPGKNDIGAILHDEECFATRTVTCIGHTIAIVVADTEAHARAAARAVKIEYEDLPALISIDDAIEAGSYYEVSQKNAEKKASHITCDPTRSVRTTLN